MGPRLRQQYARVLAGTDRSPRAGVFRAVLRGASWGYGSVVAVRSALFSLGVLPSTRVDAHVISVGNLTAGGTGKTPVAVSLAQERLGRNERVAILTRGYQGVTRGGGVVVVSDGAGMRWAGEDPGDEAQLMADLVPRAAVVACRDRVAAARFAIRELGATTLILDDGFQHRWLARDEDWVLIDALDPWGYGALLPRGLLREPPRALRRATTIVVSRADQGADLPALEAAIRRHNPHAPLRWATHAATRLWQWPNREPLALATLQGQRVLAMSGIGNPAGFETTVQHAGALIGLVRRFPDHHQYKVCDLDSADMFVRSEQLAAVVTTEKDAVRLEGLPAPQCPVWVLGIDAQLHEARPAAAVGL